MGSLLGATGVVDAYDLEQGLTASVPAAEELATDAAEPIDSNLELLLGGGLDLVGVAAALQIGGMTAGVGSGGSARGATVRSYTMRGQLTLE